MVVDDSALACAIIEEGLQAHGFEVTTFTEPREALEQIPLIKPDLVVTDLSMPEIDGSSLTRKLKASAAIAVPVIILTGNDLDGQRIAGLKAGADDYVHKGASMAELAARIDAVLRRTAETERVRRVFARYSSDAVVDEVLKQGTVRTLKGEKREVTVLFVDVRNFTGLVEERPPEVVLALLNDVLSRPPPTRCWSGVARWTSFLGDGLMAVWGAPVPHDDPATAAVSAALQMLEAVDRRNAEHPGVRIDIGVGINSGVVIAGTLGSERRSEFTCIGDTVNVASRLCGLAAPSEVLVGEGTAALLTALGPLDALEPVRVKGKAHPVPLFKLTGAVESAIRAQRRF